jgi:hypothetical protein
MAPSASSTTTRRVRVLHWLFPSSHARRRRGGGRSVPGRTSASAPCRCGTPGTPRAGRRGTATLTARPEQLVAARSGDRAYRLRGIKAKHASRY